MASASGLNSARNKLEGLLNELIEKSEDSVEGDALTLMDSLSSAMPPPSTPTKRSSSAKGPRKRRKKDLGFDIAEGSDGAKSHSSFIMKLFDRSVDFAPFVEDTPLYTLAREWMENKPHRLRLASEMQELQDSDPLSSSQGSTSSILVNDQSIDSKAVYSLPLPKFKRERKEQTCIPKPLPQPPLSHNIHYNVDTGTNINELKKQHVKRWKKVKTSWRQASLTSQAHYTPSIKKIRELFELFK